MTPTDFGLGIVASWLANNLDKWKNNNYSEDNEDIIQSDTIAHNTRDKNLEKINLTRKFRTFDVYTELKNIEEGLSSPVANLLIETEPSTHYHLVSLVLESSLTKEWYCFHRGRISFQGTGGGHQQAERVISIFRKKNIPIAVWVIDKSLLDQFESGFILWPEVQLQAVPFLAANVENQKWKWIKEQATEVIKG